jgi:hypothetical protein
MDSLSLTKLELASVRGKIGQSINYPDVFYNSV